MRRFVRKYTKSCKITHQLNSTKIEHSHATTLMTARSCLDMNLIVAPYRISNSIQMIDIGFCNSNTQALAILMDIPISGNKAKDVSFFGSIDSSEKGAVESVLRTPPIRDRRWFYAKFVSPVPNCSIGNTKHTCNLSIICITQ